LPDSILPSAFERIAQRTAVSGLESDEAPETENAPRLTLEGVTHGFSEPRSRILMFVPSPKAPVFFQFSL
jgi:hypothetical protein